MLVMFTHALQQLQFSTVKLQNVTSSVLNLNEVSTRCQHRGVVFAVLIVLQVGTTIILCHMLFLWRTYSAAV